MYQECHEGGCKKCPGDDFGFGRFELASVCEVSAERKHDEHAKGDDGGRLCPKGKCRCNCRNNQIFSMSFFDIADAGPHAKYMEQVKQLVVSDTWRNHDCEGPENPKQRSQNQVTAIEDFS